MVTVFVTWNGEREALERTVDSLKLQRDSFRGKIHLKILQSVPGELLPETAVTEWRKMFAEADVTAGQKVADQIPLVMTEMVTVVDAGEQYLGNSLELGCSFLHQKKEETDAVLLTNVSRRAAAGKKSGTESPDDVSGKV